VPVPDLVADLVLVPLDGSPLADRAAAVAARLVDPRSGRLLLLSVASGHDAEDLDRHLRDVAATVTAVPVETLVAPGWDAAQVIAGVAADRGATVCMTSHGRGALRWAVLGSVAEDIVARSTGPVVLVGPRCDESWSPGPGPVLVCNGDSELGAPVADVACAAARRFGTSVLLATVIHPLDVEGAEHPDAVFGRAASAVRTRGVDVATRLERAHAPGGVLAGIAQDQGSPVVVAATHGRHGLARLVAGSTTMTLLHASTCPVVVVSDRADDEAQAEAPASTCAAAH
jgi:nucleotide-binding universal stress UspA family protein